MASWHLLLLAISIPVAAACASVRNSREIRCAADGEYYWQCDWASEECPACNLNRTCSSDSSLFHCACPPGTIDDCGTLWVEYPFTERWWTRICFLAFIIGPFGGVLMLVSGALFFVAVAKLGEDKRRNATQIEKWLTRIAVVACFAFFSFAFYLASGSGAIGLGIAFLVSCGCFGRVWCSVSSRESIRRADTRQLRRALSDPRVVVRGIRVPESSGSAAPRAAVERELASEEQQASIAVATPVYDAGSASLAERLKQLDDALAASVLSASEHAATRAKVIESFAAAPVVPGRVVM